MAIVYNIDPVIVNDVAKNFSNSLAKYIKTVYYEPTQKIYFELLNSWSGYAAEAYLHRIASLSYNFSNINKSLISIGRSINDVVTAVVNADSKAGGVKIPIDSVVGEEIDFNNTTLNSEVDENKLNVSDDFDSKVTSLSKIISDIQYIITKIDNQKEILNNYWKVGSELPTIINAIENLILNIKTFQNEANTLIEELITSKKILLEKTNNSKGGGGGGGSEDSINCPHCFAKNSAGTTICKFCKKPMA